MGKINEFFLRKTGGKSCFLHMFSGFSQVFRRFLWVLSQQNLEFSNRLLADILSTGGFPGLENFGAGPDPEKNPNFFLDFPKFPGKLTSGWFRPMTGLPPSPSRPPSEESSKILLPPGPRRRAAAPLVSRKIFSNFFNILSGTELLGARNTLDNAAKGA
jgi:hypothetical protein